MNSKLYEESYHRPGELKPEFSYIDEPYPIEVEYFTLYPNINRIKGNGSDSLIEWFFRNLCFGAIIYISMLSIGASVINTGLKERAQSLEQSKFGGP